MSRLAWIDVQTLRSPRTSPALPPPVELPTTMLGLIPCVLISRRARRPRRRLWHPQHSAGWQAASPLSLPFTVRLVAVVALYARTPSTSNAGGVLYCKCCLDYDHYRLRLQPIWRRMDYFGDIYDIAELLLQI